MGLYIMDTHPLIWLKTHKRNKLSKKVITIIDGTNSGDDSIYIPAPVIWELGAYYKTNKFKVKKYPLFKDWINNEIFTNENIRFIETTFDDVTLSGDMNINNDPFDNLIVATAIRMGAPLITKDERIVSSGVCETIW